MSIRGKNMYYVWEVEDKNLDVQYVHVRGITLKLKDLDSCATWDNKKNALSWTDVIRNKWPAARLKIAKLILAE